MRNSRSAGWATAAVSRRSPTCVTGARRAEATLVDQGTTNGLPVHPGLLDAALQATAACLVYQLLDGAFVPLAFDEVVLLRDARPFAASRVAVWLERDGGTRPDTIRATLRLFANDGEAVMEVRGMTLRRLAKPPLDAAPEAGGTDRARDRMDAGRCRRRAGRSGRRLAAGGHTRALCGARSQIRARRRRRDARARRRGRGQ
ncbi:polyketide synthase dehydratase domain-containing protein [Burkholderia glumae]|uniref:polyketide synthase dehydratase domain-containing protein n=1 Tax=Burkholderia glumae TaxID=337 RepID=UPI0030C73B73